MQGGAVMPDQSRAPVWFLKAFVKERFAKLSIVKHYDIAAFNNMVKDTVAKHKGSEILNNNCSKCLKHFSAKSIPTQCMYCKGYFHKSTCLPSHSSSCTARPSRPSSSAPASTPLVSHPPGLPTALPSGSSTGDMYINPLKRPRVETDSLILNTSTLSLSRVNISSSSSPQSNPPNHLSFQNNPGPSINMNPRPSEEQAPGPAQPPTHPLPYVHQRPQSSQEPASVASSSSTIVEQSTLNVDAPTFLFSATNANNNSDGNTTRRRMTKPPTISPEKAKINYLNLELNAAKTRIVQLETINNDYEGTIKIQREKIRVLEETQLSTANNNYLNNERIRSCCPATTPGASYTTRPNLGACHTSHCPPCHPCSRAQPPQPHLCHPQPQTQGQPEADHTLALDEIKKAIGNVTECILNIADVIVKSQNDTDDKETNTDANIDEENLVVPNKTDDNLMNEDEKDVSDQTNESLASFDETVPELPVDQASLNSQSQTIQLL
jgi:hypothetical protein